MDRFCRACGASLRAGDRFCGSCGAPVGDGSGDRDPARERFAAAFAEPAEAQPASDDAARQRFRDTFARAGAATDATPASEPTSGGVVSVALSVLTVIAAIVLAPIGLAVLIVGGIVTVMVGLSFTGSGGGPRTADQQMAVAGTVIGAGEALIGMLALLA